MSVLSDALSSAALDALIIIGDDQKEMLRGEYIPPLLVYAGATIRSQRPPHGQNRPEWVLRGSDRYYPMDGPVDYPVASSLGRHLMAYLGEDGFQVAAAEAESGGLPMGHAFAFIHSQLMRGPPVPVVPGSAERALSTGSADAGSLPGDRRSDRTSRRGVSRGWARRRDCIRRSQPFRRRRAA